MRYLCLIALLLIGCNSADDKVAFRTYPDKMIGYLEIYTPIGWGSPGVDVRHRLVYESIEKTMPTGFFGSPEGHWEAFRRNHWSSVPHVNWEAVRLYVYDCARLNGNIRAGVLGYTEPKRNIGTPTKIHIVCGEYYELPDLTRQLHTAFIEHDPSDTVYWTAVLGEQDGIVSLLRQLHGGPP